MKIKEVIEKTGLTDRAIRLYIDEGLVLPNIDESYSGRKSIDFSQIDVDRLNNVALLRKAGFSIADIKSVVDDNSTAKNIIEKFIEQTEQNIAHETKIVEKLKGISFDEEVTLETICDSLSETVEEKQVPSEDMKSSFWNKIEKNIYKAVGIAGLTAMGITVILFAALWLHEFKHITGTESWFSWILICFSGWIFVGILSTLLILFNRDKSTKRNKKPFRIISAIITVLILISGVVAFFISIFSALMSPFYSYTTDVDDYLVLDSWVEEYYGEEIRSFFPAEIPEEASESSDNIFLDTPFTTKYYYRYAYNFDTFIDIVAEWKLHLIEYEKAKEEALKKEYYRTEQKGDWTLVYYRDDDLRDSDEYYFAYNDNQRKVRYIAEITYGSRSGEPYYLSLDW